MSLSPAAEEVLRQLMELPAEEREAVVNALRASLEGTSWELHEPELGARYGAAEVVMSTDQPTPEEEAELNRRLAAVRSGEMPTYSHEEVMSELQLRLAGQRTKRGVSA
jgi:hypothetical protein